MRIMIICSVRDASEETMERQREYVEMLEKEGHEVRWPPRDTKQEDETGGFNICNDNRIHIKTADEIHIMYDEKSQGSHFDLGMAFMANKPLVLVDCPPADLSCGKSFKNMMHYWQTFGARG